MALGPLSAAVRAARPSPLNAPTPEPAIASMRPVNCVDAADPVVARIGDEEIAVGGERDIRRRIERDRRAEHGIPGGADVGGAPEGARGRTGPKPSDHAFLRIGDEQVAGETDRDTASGRGFREAVEGSGLRRHLVHVRAGPPEREARPEGAQPDDDEEDGRGRGDRRGNVPAQSRTSWRSGSRERDELRLHRDTRERAADDGHRAARPPRGADHRQNGRRKQPDGDRRHAAHRGNAAHGQHDRQHDGEHHACRAGPKTAAEPEQASPRGVFLDQKPQIEPAPSADGQAQVAIRAPPVVRFDGLRGAGGAQHVDKV